MISSSRVLLCSAIEIACNNISKSTSASGEPLESFSLVRNSINARRSIIAEYDLESGHKVQLKDLIWLRPGNGISVSKTKKLLGRKIKSKVKAGDLVVMDNLE